MMPDQDLNPMEVMPALSDKEMDELDNFLMSDATSNEVMMLDAPTLDSNAQAERVIGLITRHLNAIVWNLQQEPDLFEPVFDLQVYVDDEREYVDGEMWAHGYMTGINMQRDSWKALFESKHGVEILQPIRLLGSADVSPEEEELTKTPAQREELSKPIPASVAWIYKFWAPQRAAAERAMGKTSEHENQKISRNAPCPCGSGRKFKKCCGASTVSQ
jgi:uncharacterized protein